MTSATMVSTRRPSRCQFQRSHRHSHNNKGHFARRGARRRSNSGTLNGLGERCGNANLCSLTAEDAAFEGISGSLRCDDKLATLTTASLTLDDMLNRCAQPPRAHVGEESAFVTKTGIHASAVLKDPRTYEHVRPEAVGHRRKVLVWDPRRS